jgi:Ran GTPase-activating protein 1
MASSAGLYEGLAPIPAADTLACRGPRGGLDAARARELAAPALTGARTDFRRVVLSTWALSVGAAEVFAEALARLPRLESAVLADIIAGRPEAEGLAVYRALGAALAGVQLREIDLSDNAVGPKGVDACRAFLAGQAALPRLFFCNCGISAEAARSIADLLLFRTPTQLRTLHFHNNMSGNGGALAVADVVAASPHLADFRFGSSRGGNDGGVALAAALAAAGGSLRRVDLEDNTFGVRGARALGATLGALAGCAVPGSARAWAHVCALDVSSGVEAEGAAKGVKDAAKVAAFVQGVVRGGGAA